jgi:hypothetical protein
LDTWCSKFEHISVTARAEDKSDIHHNYQQFQSENRHQRSLLVSSQHRLNAFFGCFVFSDIVVFLTTKEGAAKLS